MCEHPIRAFLLRSIPLNAKIYIDNPWLSNPYTKLRFSPPEGKQAKNYYEIKVPCGWCLECRLKKARDWSTRCYLENKMHENSCFVTLTYDNKHLPYKDGEPSLRIEDIQNFFKRLKKKYPDKQILRFWAGEYGEKRGRPHYHAIIFGYKPTDLEKLRKPSNRGYTVYNSAELRKIWGMGHIVIGNVTAESAGYVARYTMKKAGIKPEKRDWRTWTVNKDWYNWKKNHKPEDWHKNPFRTWDKPEKKGRIKERCNSSKRPAIGLTSWLLNMQEYKKNGMIPVYANGKVQMRTLPPYFIKKWKEEDYEAAYDFCYKQQTKFEREHIDMLKKTHQTEEEWRMRQTEKLHKKTRLLKRNEEYDTQAFEDIFPHYTTATLDGSVPCGKT